MAKKRKQMSAKTASNVAKEIRRLKSEQEIRWTHGRHKHIVSLCNSLDEQGLLNYV